MQGYNFTERVRKCLALAREEAARLRHEYVGTEHILLGLVAEGEGVAATVLQNLGVDLDDLAFRVDQIVKKGEPGKKTGPDLPYTSRAKKVLEHAMLEARQLNHSYVGTEHLLLGLIAEKKGIAAQVLVDRGVTLEKAAAETIRILGTEMPRPSPAEFVSRFDLSVQLSTTTREILRFAEAAVEEFGGVEISPVHVAIALLRRRVGIPPDLLELSGCDRDTLLRALEQKAREEGSPS